MLNATGLVAGLTASFILIIFTINELRYDRYYKNESRMYRVISHDQKGNQYALSAYAFGPLLLDSIDGIEKIGRIAMPAFITGPMSVRVDGVFQEEKNFYCADPEILDLFDVEIVRGTKSQCLAGGSSVILSEKRAEEVFGNADPIGRHIQIRTAGVTSRLEITGIFKSFPWNSTLQMDFIANLRVYTEIMSDLYDSASLVRQLQADPSIETFLLLSPGVTPDRTLKQIADVVKKSLNETTVAGYDLQPLREIYLGSAQINDMIHKRGNKSTMYIYLSLAFFILLLAGINYAILSTARSALRYKEIGVRKVMGATRWALSGQMLTESVLLALLSFPVSYVLIGLMEPLLQWLFGYETQVYSAGVMILLPLFAAITIFIGLISGFYIAFYLSSLNPIDALKNKLASHKKISLSRIFIVFQLVITISLLISVITIYRQVQYCIKSDIGINQRNLLVIPFDPNEFRSYSRLKQDLSRLPEVISVSGISIVPPDLAIPTVSMLLSEIGQPLKVELIAVDSGFFTTMGIPILSGTDFRPSDTSQHTASRFIVNQSLTQMIKQKVGGIINISGEPVIGVVRDFNLHTVRSRINPIFFAYKPEMIRAVVLRYREGSLKEVTSKAKMTWDNYAPGQAFIARDFSTERSGLYKKERVFGSLVGAFTILAFIIMGMGLFGLALLISERKRKETAIRKVFGATDRDIIFGMQKEFLIYSVIAAILSIPLMASLLPLWLDLFYYKIRMGWWVFALSFVAVTIFVSSIILFRTWKMTRENPANALKYE